MQGDCQVVPHVVGQYQLTTPCAAVKRGVVSFRLKTIIFATVLSALSEMAVRAGFKTCLQGVQAAHSILGLFLQTSEYDHHAGSVNEALAGWPQLPLWATGAAKPKEVRDESMASKAYPLCQGTRVGCKASQPVPLSDSQPKNEPGLPGIVPSRWKSPFYVPSGFIKKFLQLRFARNPMVVSFRTVRSSQ